MSTETGAEAAVLRPCCPVGRVSCLLTELSPDPVSFSSCWLTSMMATAVVGMEVAFSRLYRRWQCFSVWRRRRTKSGCVRCSCCGDGLFPSDVHRENNRREFVGNIAILFHWRGCTGIPPLTRRLSTSFFRRDSNPVWVVSCSSLSSYDLAVTPWRRRWWWFDHRHCSDHRHFASQSSLFSSLMEIPYPSRTIAHHTLQSNINKQNLSWIETRKQKPTTTLHKFEYHIVIFRR